MIEAVLIMQAFMLIILSSLAVYKWRYRFDVRRVADVMAADLLEKYQDDVGQLGEHGVKEYATQRYIQLAATFGLPSSPADKVAGMVWTVVDNAQGVQPQRVEAPVIYE